MLRFLLILIALVALPRPAIDPLPPGKAAAMLRRKLETAQGVSPAVEARFALAAAATARCGRMDNLYSYDLLLQQFDAEARAVVAESAHGGQRRPADPRTVGDCAALVRTLAEADDRLLILAERVAHGEPLGEGRPASP